VDLGGDDGGLFIIIKGKQVMPREKKVVEVYDID
jgi:hypothetical protein